MAFVCTATVTYLAIGRFDRGVAEATVSFGGPGPTTPSDIFTPYEAAQKAGGSVIQYCSNNIYEFVVYPTPDPPPPSPEPETCPPRKPSPPSPDGPPGPDSPPSCGQCSVGQPQPVRPLRGSLRNSGLDGRGGAQQFGMAPGLPGRLMSDTGSIVDNASFNYIHIATDFNGSTGSSSFACPRLTRFYRSREQATIGSFGSGGFCTYDIKLKQFTTTVYGGGGPTSVFVVPDANTAETTRTYVFDPNSPSGRTTRGSLTYFDTNNNPVTPSNGTVPRTVRYVEYTAEDKTLYRFETLQTATNGNFDTDRSTDARLIRMQDKNGYGTTVTYPTLTATQVQTSYDLQWQIDQVIGDDGETLTFTYHNVQYGGRWCVSQIAFPSGLTNSYAYSGSRITTITGSDGVTSTFTYGGLYKNTTTNIVTDNPANGPMVAETITFVDPAASVGHQRKTVILTLANINVDPNQTLITQASQLVRSVINESNEVTYQNFPFANQQSNSYTDVYEGQGLMKRVINHAATGIGVQYYADGWQQLNGTLTGSVESSPQTYSARSPAPSSITEANGETKTYTYLPYDYKSGWWISQITYSDTTTETFTYDADHRVTRYKDRLNRVTKYTYDALGNRLSKQVGLLDNGMGGETTTPETATTTYEYYAAGNANQYLLKSETDPLGNKTDYEYDANHRLSKIIAPPDTVGGARAETTYSYDAAGRLSTVITPGGWGTSYDYDVRNRLTKTTHADNSTERYFYGTGANANLLEKVKDRAGTVTKYEYDDSGRRIKTIQSYATMDLADNETLITDPALKVEETVTYLTGTDRPATRTRAGEVTTYTYDYRHRLVETKTQPRVGTFLTSKQVYKDNKLFSSEDPYGRKTFYAYRSSDAALVRTIQATVPSVTYADFAAVLAATRAAPTTPNPTSLITDYTLDNAGQTTATLDPLGITHTVTYDSRGRTTEQIAAFGTAVASKTKTIYDLASRVTEVQHPRYFDTGDANGLNKAKTTMTYTGRGLLASRTDSPGTPEAATETYTYNIEGRQLTRVDARGFTWTTLWNTCCGRQQGSYDPYGHGTIVNVDNLGRATHTATVSNVTAHSGNYKDPIDAQTLGEVTTKYDTRGRVTARTVWLTALGQVDPNNVPIYTGAPVNDTANPPAAPYGLTTTYTYDDDLDDTTGLDATFSAHLAGLSLGTGSDGSAVLVTQPAGERTLTIKDGLGRSVRTVGLNTNDTAAYSSSTGFDTLVNISGYGDVLETTSTNLLNDTNRSRTDGAGRTIQSLDQTSAITAFTYDAGGRRLSVRDPNNVGQDCTYDQLGRDLSCTDTAGAVTSQTYDLAGNVLTQVDAKSHTTTLVYDSRGRKTSLTDRISATTTWTFDAAGNELTMTDAESQTTTYTYDNAGRRLTIQWPDHVAGTSSGNIIYGIEATSYDTAGRKWRSTNQLGDTITHAYDMASRLKKKDYRLKVNSPSGTVSATDTFTYDANSRMLKAISGVYTNTVTLTYDALGRKNRETLSIAGQPYQMTINYDSGNRVQNVVYPDGTYVQHQYNSRNLLSILKYPDNGAGSTIDTRTYDAGGRLSSETLGNGLVVNRTYVTGDNLPLAISNSAVGDYTYAWDANKNKTGETIAGTMAPYSSTMAFDDQNRLTTWNRSNGDSQAWTLSAVNDWSSFTNNGTAVARTHGPTHEVLTVGTATITHDSRGNMTTDEFAITRTYDWNNKVSQAVVPTGSVRGIVGTHDYQYDALGRRVRKTIGGSSPSDTVFVHLGEQIYADYTAGAVATSPDKKYVWGSYVDELVCQINGTTKYYIHRNQQYSTTAITAQSGTPAERYGYTSYGDLRVLNPNTLGIRTTPPMTRYTYTGREFDHETGAYHFRARIYSPTLGRFTGHDPILYPDGYNTYAGWFVPGNVDSDGLSISWPSWYRRPWIPPLTPIGASCRILELEVLSLLGVYDNPGAVVTAGVAIRPDGGSPESLFWNYFYGDGSTFTMPPEFITTAALGNGEFSAARVIAAEICRSGGQPPSPPHIKLDLRNIPPHEFSLGTFRINGTFTCVNCKPCWSLQLQDDFNFDPKNKGKRPIFKEALTRLIALHQSACDWRPFLVRGEASWCE